MFGYRLKEIVIEEEWEIVLWDVEECEGNVWEEGVGMSEVCGWKGFAIFTAPCVALLRSEQLSDQPPSSLISLLLCPLPP